MSDRLFDLLEATSEAKVGMERADRAERVQEWKIAASRWLDELPAGTEIVADSLIAAVGLPDTGPNRNNVVGAWFNAQSKRGTIRFANRLRKSERVDRHVGLQRVWIVA